MTLEVKSSDTIDNVKAKIDSVKAKIQDEEDPCQDHHWQDVLFPTSWEFLRPVLH
jgi:hypothetical protein